MSQTNDGAIVLTKGERINLSKSAPALTKVRIGLFWKENGTDTGADFDADVSVFACKHDAAGNPKLLSNRFFVFYNNKNSPDGAIEHLGDNLTGSAATDAFDKDTETITVDLSKLNPEVDEVSIITTIYDADTRKQNFGQISAARARLYDDATGAKVAEYNLEDDFSSETAVQFGSLYRNEHGEWSFKAIGTGYHKGLDAFVTYYGGII